MEVEIDTGRGWNQAWNLAWCYGQWRFALLILSINLDNLDRFMDENMGKSDIVSTLSKLASIGDVGCAI